MERKIKIPNREPDFIVEHYSQTLKFWWKELVQTNEVNDGGFSIYDIKLHPLSYRGSAWDLDAFCEYECFLIKSDFEALQKSYVNWVVEQELLRGEHE